MTTIKQRMTYTEFLDQSPMTSFLWLLLVGVSLAQILDGFELQSTTFALPRVIDEFHITPAQAGFIPGATNFGLLIGALVFGVLSDRFGRRAIFQFVIATYAIGSLLSALAPSYEFLVAARIFAGLGIGAEFPVAFALLSEFSPVKYRHLFLMAGPFTNASGYILTALLALWLVPTFGWRSMYFFGILPLVLILYLRRFVPESVRYLLAHGRDEEAGRVARQLADQAGYRDVELIPPEREVKELNARVDKRALYRSVLPAFVALLLVYFFQYIQATGITSWLPTLFVRQGFALAQSFQFTLVILCGTTLSAPLAGWLQEAMNRKVAMLLQGFVGGAFFVGAGLTFAARQPIELSVALLFLTALFAQGMITVLYTLASELFPTPIRSVSMAIVSAAARVGSIVGPVLTGFLLTSGAEISQVIYVFCVPLVLAALIALVLIRVDPRQKSLERIQLSAGAAASSIEPVT